MSKMNIWYIHHYATPYEIAGLHRPFEFGEYFIDRGNQVTVFTSSFLHYTGKNMIKDGKQFISKRYIGGDAVFVKTCSYRNSGIKRIINMLEFFIRIFCISRKLIQNNNIPDVIIASSPHPFALYAGIKIAKRNRISCVCEIRDLWPEVFFYSGRVKEKSLFGKMLLAGEKYLYEKATALLFLKEGDHTYILDHKWDINNGGNIDIEKCYYVNNGVDIKLFDLRSKKYIFHDEDLNNNKFKVIYCGTIRPVNHVDMLLDVGKILGDSIEILIFGTGDCIEELTQRIKNEKISNVKIKGYVDNKYVPSILSRSSINILNYSGTAYNWSRGNSSNKLFEYLASGKPVVSTVKMGYDILEKYNCGLSAKKCTPKDIADLINTIRSMSIQEYQCLCKNARMAAEKFDIPILAEKYMEILNKLQGENKND